MFDLNMNDDNWSTMPTGRFPAHYETCIISPLLPTLVNAGLMHLKLKIGIQQILSKTGITIHRGYGT